ncbi:MAG: hypothetical protein HUU20_08430 [Pirellulales bacterium]|nr:hypothetical protein [Pirellulales bacterium]
MQTKWLGPAVLLPVLSAVFAPAALAEAAEKIPIVYSTDLLHPHDDPDDHYDLATLFALDEFDLRGILLDLGERQTARMGRPPVEQMIKITGREVPYRAGLDRSLRGPGDTAAGGSAESQGGIELLLSALRKCHRPAVLFTTGSCRDVAAAFNREPDLMKEKVRALYVNAGNGPQGPQWEYNVQLDEEAYFRLFDSGLPLYWCPCWSDEPGNPEAILGRKVYATYYVADQAQVVGACSPRVRNYFVYCLTRSGADPLAFLDSGEHPLPTGKRNMWCTAVFLHAAGREIYERDPQDFVALPPEQAAREGLQGRKATPYEFVPLRATRRDASAPETQAATSGGWTAVYGGRCEDHVGNRQAGPDGKRDCLVRLSGVPGGTTVRNVVLTGPKEGRWELQETGRWWRVFLEPSGDRLDCWFSFYAAGPHRMELQLDDGKTEVLKFDVPQPPATALESQLDAAKPNARVFHITDELYPEILASALKNLLAGLGQ